VCITLNPHDPNRAQKAIQEIRKLGFKDPQFLLGVNGHQMTDEQIKSVTTPRAFYELKNGRYVHEALSSPGCIGCYLAHVKAWKLSVKLEESLAIFEDDFVAKPGSQDHISQVLKDAKRVNFDVLRLQHRGNPDTGESLKPIPDTFLSEVDRTDGTTAYIVTPKAARTLLSTAFPIDCQVDHYLNMASYYHGLKNLSSRRNLFDDPEVGSTIQHNSLKRFKPPESHHQNWILILGCLLVVVLGWWNLR